MNLLINLILIWNINFHNLINKNGVLDFWAFRLLDFWVSCLLDFWDLGYLDFWDFKHLGHFKTILWNKHWNVGLCHGYSGHPSNTLPVHSISYVPTYTYLRYATLLHVYTLWGHDVSSENMIFNDMFIVCNTQELNYYRLFFPWPSIHIRPPPWTTDVCFCLQTIYLYIVW